MPGAAGYPSPNGKQITSQSMKAIPRPLGSLCFRGGETPQTTARLAGGRGNSSCCGTNCIEADGIRTTSPMGFQPGRYLSKISPSVPDKTLSAPLHAPGAPNRSCQTSLIWKCFGKRKFELSNSAFNASEKKISGLLSLRSRHRSAPSITLLEKASPDMHCLVSRITK